MQQEATIPTLEQRIPESDILPHLEDDDIVNAIRDGRLVRIRWNDLYESEKRAAYDAIFRPCDIY